LAAEIRVLPVRALDVRWIARRMRRADRDEVWKASGMTPVEAITYSLRKSSAAWTVSIDGRAEAIFGVGAINILAGVGAPWLLGTDAIERHSAGFLRGSVEWRDQLLRHYLAAAGSILTGVGKAYEGINKPTTSTTATTPNKK